MESRIGIAFDAVGGVFQEGKPAFRGSALRLRSHIQIAVRDPGCILGYLKPLLDDPAAVGKLGP
jgi:hypothetical protein